MWPLVEYVCDYKTNRLNNKNILNSNSFCVNFIPLTQHIFSMYKLHKEHAIIR